MEAPLVGGKLTLRVSVRPERGKLSLPVTCGDLRIPPVPLPRGRRRLFNQSIRALD